MRRRASIFLVFLYAISVFSILASINVTAQEEQINQCASQNEEVCDESLPEKGVRNPETVAGDEESVSTSQVLGVNTDSKLVDTGVNSTVTITVGCMIIIVTGLMFRRKVHYIFYK